VIRSDRCTLRFGSHYSLAFGILLSGRTSGFASQECHGRLLTSAKTWTAPDRATIPEGPWATVSVWAFVYLMTRQNLRRSTSAIR